MTKLNDDQTTFDVYAYKGRGVPVKRDHLNGRIKSYALRTYYVCGDAIYIFPKAVGYKRSEVFFSREELLAGSFELVGQTSDGVEVFTWE